MSDQDTAGATTGTNAPQPADATAAKVKPDQGDIDEGSMPDRRDVGEVAATPSKEEGAAKTPRE